MMKKLLSTLIVLILSANSLTAGISFVRSSGITLTGADGITLTGADGLNLTGADGFLNFWSNGITLTGADGLPLGLGGSTTAGPGGAGYTGPNSIAFPRADGITLTGADGITLTGADGITLTGADGLQYTANSLLIRRPNGITLTGADGTVLSGTDGITLTGADGATRFGTNGITLTGADGITLTGADGITLTGADGITLTGADSITGLSTNGVVFELVGPTGITLTGADGITLTGADGINILRPVSVTLLGLDLFALLGLDDPNGILSIDPELALTLDALTDDTGVNAVIVYHNAVTEADLDQLRQVGIIGGTRYKVLPAICIIANRVQLAAISRLPSVRSIYGNRTLNFASDPYFNPTGIQRVAPDADLRAANNSTAVSGSGVTVAVLDTGINALHADLAGKVVQNVRALDLQGVPLGFLNPIPLENLPNTDLLAGHGTFVSGVIAGRGILSNGKYAGVAPGAKLLGVGVGELSLLHVLAGFDYILDKGAAYNVRVVNCSFSANTVFDLNDPVNVATKMLTDRGVSVVFSAGNEGPGNGTLNPYAAAPWVVGVGAADVGGDLASYSSRGSFGDALQHPSLVAPGTNIVSLRSLATLTGTTGLLGADLQRLSLLEIPFYTTSTGTSFSAPQVAGAIALMLQVNPDLTPAQIKDILSRTATPMPKYFYHEAGAGMLNTHAAVLEAAFAGRRMGVFRSTLSANRLQFSTSATSSFSQTVYPGLTASKNITIQPDTLQATVSIGWGFGLNDLGMKMYSSGNTLVGSSNQLGLLGLTGRREKIVLNNPPGQTYRIDVRHALLGTAQDIFGTVETTKVQYPTLTDLNALSPASAAEVKESLLTHVMQPVGQRFDPGTAISRGDFAAVFVRGGLVPQYVASAPAFIDVQSSLERNMIESVQFNPSGKLIFDASNGGRFYPNNPTTKLAAAIAFVKAAKLEGSTTLAFLPLFMADTSAIPAQWRGYVAVALQKGYLKQDGNKFNPNRAVTRLEVAHAINMLTR